MFKTWLLAITMSLLTGCGAEDDVETPELAHHSSAADASNVAQNSFGKLMESNGRDTLLLASGQTLSVQELADSLVVINFWAIWCAPCRSEIPELNALYTEHSVSVLGVEFDRREGEELQSAIADMDIHFPVLTAESAAGLDFRWPEALPVTLIVINLRVASVLYGPQTRASLKNAILKAKSGIGRSDNA